ncbi:MAG: PaaI family thioesterase [Betaproteobacteria bacterium]|nr:PaaI family thioesterase [Betaproteobacteria bacterium]
MTDQILEQWHEQLRVIPYNRELDMRFGELTERGCVLCLPYRNDLIGDPESGALHVGAIAALIDTTFGYSVYRRIGERRGFATLDLRIEHLHRSTAGQDIFCIGDCHKVTADLAFVRGRVYHDDPAAPIATAVGIFMFTGGVLPMASGKDVNDAV